MPSLLAVIVLFPRATPVTVNDTVPVPLLVAVSGKTVATAAFELDRVTLRLASKLLLASRRVTVPGSVPARIRESGATTSATLETGASTVIAEEPETPSTVAVTVADPPFGLAGSDAVTSPVPLTPAMFEGIEPHEVTREPRAPPGPPPAITFPAESSGAALSCWVAALK